jgi:hypothetical protein
LQKPGEKNSPRDWNRRFSPNNFRFVAHPEPVEAGFAPRTVQQHPAINPKVTDQMTVRDLTVTRSGSVDQYKIKFREMQQEY